MSKRTDGTDMVTATMFSWLWRRRCRIMAGEVGLTTAGRFSTPLKGKWRIDVVGVVGKRVFLIEVKGSKADLTREKMDRGKWTLDYGRFVIMPWLAVVDDASDRCLEMAPDGWGVISVKDYGEVSILRKPPSVAIVDDSWVFPGIAQTLSMQMLPFSMGKKDKQRSLGMLEVVRPWRHWEEDK